MKRHSIDRYATLSCQQGMTIIETLIAAAIISVSALVAAMAIQQSVKSAAKIESQSKVVSLTDVIAARMYTPEACRASVRMKSGDFAKAALANAAGNASASIELRAQIGGFALDSSSASIDQLKVQRLALENVREVRTSPPLYVGLVMLKVESAKLSLDSVPFRDRIVTPLFVEFNPDDSYKWCYVKESPQTLCAALGGSWNPTQSPPCILPFVNVRCQGNSNFLRGFDANGLPDCSVPASLCPPGEYMIGLPSTLGQPPSCRPLAASAPPASPLCSGTALLGSSVRCGGDPACRSNSSPVNYASSPGTDMGLCSSLSGPMAPGQKCLSDNSRFEPEFIGPCGCWLEDWVNCRP